MQNGRRRLLKALTLGAGAAVGSRVLPTQWSRPIASIGLLPAHAVASGGATFFRAGIPLISEDFDAGLTLEVVVSGGEWTSDLAFLDPGPSTAKTWSGSGTVGGGESELTDTSTGDLSCIQLDAFLNVLSCDSTEAICSFRVNSTRGDPFSVENASVPVGAGTVPDDPFCTGAEEDTVAPDDQNLPAVGSRLRPLEP